MIEGDIGAREIIRTNQGQIIYVELDDPTGFVDIDSQQDLENLITEWAKTLTQAYGQPNKSAEGTAAQAAEFKAIIGAASHHNQTGYE